MKRIIIIGATSGIGHYIAIRYAQKGYLVGITGRREELLLELKQQFPENIFVQPSDICQPNCTNYLESLIEQMGGMDILFINSGVGKQNADLLPEIEMQTVETNVTGFTRLIVFGFNYFKKLKKGHIVVTSSVAGTRALRQCPSYSATKRYMRHYVDCLAQKSYHDKLNIKFTTLLPGFIDTDLIKGTKYPFTVSLDVAGKRIFNAIEKEKRSVILPFKWNFIVGAWKLIPKFIWERLC